MREALVRRHRKMFFLLAFLLCAFLPATAYADGAEDVEKPDGTGVTNPAASIELVESTDSQFYLYSYDGTETPVLPEDYPYYKESHTVYVKVTGEDATKACDDNVLFYSGNACDVKTVSQGKVEGEENLWYCELTMAGHDGPAPYTVITSSGQEVSFMARAATIPGKVTLSRDKVELSVGQAYVLTGTSTGTFTSSDSAVASVRYTGTASSSGVITAVASGEADITYTYEGYGLTLTAVCHVTVKGESATTPSDDSAAAVPTPEVKQAAAIQAGETVAAGQGNTAALYQVTDAEKRTVTYVSCASSKAAAVIPASVTLADGQSYQVTKVAPKAFQGTPKVKKVTVKIQKLSKTAVKNCLKKSKVKTVKLSNRKNKKYFTKKICGKTVKIR